MIFHENRLLADISLHYLCQKLGKMLQNVWSAAVVIGALRVDQFWLILQEEVTEATTVETLRGVMKKIGLEEETQDLLVAS